MTPTDDVRLRDHIEAMLREQGERVKLALEAAHRAEAAADRRVEAAGREQAAIISGIDRRMVDLTDRVTRMEGRSSGALQLWAIILGAVGLISAIAAIVARLAGP